MPTRRSSIFAETTQAKAKCSTIGADAADDAAKDAARAAFCANRTSGTGGEYDASSANVFCASTTCSKDTPTDVAACCTFGAHTWCDSATYRRWFPALCRGFIYSPPAPPPPPPPPPPNYLAGYERQNNIKGTPAHLGPTKDPVVSRDHVDFRDSEYGYGYDTACRACCACLHMNDKKLGRVNNCGFAGVEGLYETRFTWSLEHDSYQWSSSNAHRFMGCMDTLGEDPATPQFGEYPSCTTPKCAYVGVRLGSGSPARRRSCPTA